MQSFRTCLNGLVKETGPVRGKILVSVLIGACQVTASLFFVWISKRVVDIATGHFEGPLGRNVAIMAGIMLVQILLTAAARYWEGLIVVKDANRTRSAVFERVMLSSWNGKDRFHSGDTVNRIVGDINEVVDFVCVNLPQAIVTLLQLVAAAVFLYKLSPSLMWILLVIMPIAVVASRLFFRRMRRLSGEIRARDSEIQGHMQENIQHRVVVKTLGATSGVMEKLTQMQSGLQKKTVSRLRYAAFSRGFMQLGFSAGYALAFFWGVYGLHNGTVTYGLMVAFLQLVGQVQRPVADIARHIPAFIRALASEERLQELTGLPQEEVSDGMVLQGAPGIRINDVSFAYEGARNPVISHFSCDFRPGTLTVICGPTGAGKTTLIRLILSLLRPSSGSVSIYDSDGEYPMESRLRCNLRYVPQGNTLMSGTIRQNLLLAKPDATEDELRDVLHLAAADFVFELADALDTPCAEVGAGISEGQAQRIAVARALLRPGGVLILDEATSSLDARTELDLLTRLSDRYRGNKTILCITHRPAAADFADAVVQMQ